MALWDRLIQSGADHDRRAQELWNRAQKYFEGKLYNRALKDLSEAIELNPGFAHEAMELMNVFSSQGGDEQALSVGLALLKVDNQNPELMNRLANSLRRLGSFSRARKLYTLAIKLAPEVKEYKYNLAACSFSISASDSDLTRQTRAVEAYTEPRRYGFMGVRQDFYPIPNQVLEDPRAARTKAKGKKAEEPAEEEQDEEARAQMIELLVKQLREDISASQGAWEDEFNLGLFYDLVGYGELAVQHLTLATERAGEQRPEPGNNLGVAVMVHKNDLVEAETVLLHNLSLHRYDRTTVLNLAVLYRKQSKPFQTLKYYVYLGDLLAKSLGEFTTDKVEQRAQDLFQRRKYLEAVPIFENLAKEKQEPYWYEKLAIMFFNQKREDQYIKALKDLLRLAPDNEDALAKISAAAKNYEDQAHEKLTRGSKRLALQLMEKAVKIEETAERWVELAQLYEDEGEEIMMDNAIRRWKQLSGQETEQAQPAEAAEAAT